MRTLVVGGGITGLTVTHALAAARRDVVLAEAGPRLGGKVATSRRDGFLIEHGPDAFLTAPPPLLELCRTLGLEGELVGPLEPRSVAVAWRGRRVPLPDGMALVAPTRLGPFLRTPLLGPLAKLRAGLDLVLPRSPADADPAVGPFVRRRLGAAVAERVAAPLLGGLGGGDIESLSLRAAFPSLWEMEQRHGSLIRAALAARRRAPASPPPPFLALRHGMGRLVERLTAALDPADVRLNAPIHALEVIDGGYRARLTGGAHLDAERVVLAVPAEAASRLLRSAAPHSAQQLRGWAVGSSAVVTLAYRDEDLPVRPPGHGLLAVPGEGLRIGALTFSSAKWPGRAPPGTWLFRAFLARPETTDDPDPAALIEVVLDDLERLLGIRAEPIFSRLDRQRETMPQYLVGHRERVDAAERVLADEVPGIVVAGAAYRGVGLAACVAQGLSAAARVG